MTMADDGADKSDELDCNSVKVTQSDKQFDADSKCLSTSQGTEASATSLDGFRTRPSLSSVSLEKGLLSSSDQTGLCCSTPVPGDEGLTSNSNSNNLASEIEGLKPGETNVYGSMKKDDSGIDVEKSPTSVKDNSLPSDGEGNESISESLFTDSATGSRTNSMSEYKGKATMEEDPSEVDDGAFSGDVVSQFEEAGPQPCDGTDSSVSGPAEAAAESDASSADMRSSVKRRLPRRSSSSSSDDADEDSVDDKTKDKASDSDEEDYSAFETPRKQPKHRWRAVPEMRLREIGIVNTKSNLLFQDRITGCLRMVQRLELQTKLDYHVGCVNTLSFNRIG